MRRNLASFMAAAAVILMALPAGAVGRDYLIYFGFNSEDVTREAELVLNEVRYAAVSAMVTKILITGHCDSAESSPDRLALSRAQNVADYLRQNGLDVAIEIETRGEGNKRPAVKSPPGTKNVENRRVVIEFQ